MTSQTDTEPAPGTACHTYKQNKLAQVRTVFEAHTTEHELTVLADRSTHPIDAAPYRHLRLAQPGTIMYHWDIITWPGHLATTGDIADGYTFARVHDMVGFFSPAPEPYRINPEYWAEKLAVAQRDSITAFDDGAMIAAALDAIDISHIESGELGDWKKPWVDALRTQVREQLSHAMMWPSTSPIEAAYEFLQSWTYTPEQLAADLGEPAVAVHGLPDRGFSFNRIGEDYELVEQAKVYDFHLLLAMHAIVWGLERYREYVGTRVR